ncbi:MAG: hemolysin III family protein [Bacteroidaceae bacterium]|nr:hemolysin III family protein [Bacteroidaceae bacterium]
MKDVPQLFQEESSNHWTHLVGVIFALSCIWMVWPAVSMGWQWAMGVLFFITGMFLMFLSSTIYHWLPEGKARRILRKCDHISIYVMIACSYTPICIAVVGGWLGWTIFGVLWAVVMGGTIYKIVALGRYPRLSLALYLLMGWSVVFIAKPVYEQLSTISLLLILLEGLLYTTGTYFFAKDTKRHYHAIWHVFVLLGAICHWAAILFVMSDRW